MRPEVILKRVLESYPGSTSIVASEKVAERLASEGLTITGRTIRSYTKAERRPSERFCIAFAKLYGPFEQDEWVAREELAKPYVPAKMPELTAADKETRRLQLLVNRFCDWCVGGDDTHGRTPRCPDATCILRPASPLPLAPNAKSKPVASAERWD